jgi:hypothetical protein
MMVIVFFTIDDVLSRKQMKTIIYGLLAAGLLFISLSMGKL